MTRTRTPIRTKRKCARKAATNCACHEIPESQSADLFNKRRWILRSWGWNLTIRAVCGWTQAWSGLKTGIFGIPESSAIQWFQEGSLTYCKWSETYVQYLFDQRLVRYLVNIKQHWKKKWKKSNHSIRASFRVFSWTKTGHTRIIRIQRKQSIHVWWQPSASKNLMSEVRLMQNLEKNHDQTVIFDERKNSNPGRYTKFTLRGMNHVSMIRFWKAVHMMFTASIAYRMFRTGIGQCSSNNKGMSSNPEELVTNHQYYPDFEP